MEDWKFRRCNEIESIKQWNSLKLHLAVRRGDIHEIQSLIAEKVDVNSTSINGETALHLAAYLNSRYTSKIIHLLLNAGANVNARSEDGLTPLHFAVLTGNIAAVAALLDHRANVNCQDNILHFTPLHLAAYFGNVNIITKLIICGANMDQTARDDLTPLHVASLKGCLATVTILVDWGASVECLTQSGHTMLHLALMDREEDVYKVMNIDDNRSECSPYLKAIGIVDVRLREGLYNYLVAKGINVNTKDYFGKTPLHLAAACRSGLAVKWLLLLNANIYLKDNNGYLAFHYTLINDNIRGLWDLLKCGADVNDVYAIKSLIPRIMREKPIARELIAHLIKLKVANLYVAQVYRPYVNIRSNYICYRDCKEEVEKMQSYYITSNITVYDLLHMSPKTRRALITSPEHTGFKQYSHVSRLYAGIIEASYREIVHWNLIVNSAIPALHEITRFPLPDLCVSRILSYLDSVTLRAIIETVS